MSLASLGPDPHFRAGNLELNLNLNTTGSKVRLRGQHPTKTENPAPVYGEPDFYLSQLQIRRRSPGHSRSFAWGGLGSGRWQRLLRNSFGF